MAKFFFAILVFGFLSCVEAADQCSVAVDQTFWGKSKENWAKPEDSCTIIVKEQVQMEMNASITYIAMGAHFLKSANYRPGVAGIFLKHGNEERQHAIALMEYLIMRGVHITRDIIQPLTPEKTSWTDVFEALKSAWKIERDVRDSFTTIIRTCEGDGTNDNDYHMSDFLTGNFLGEQHEGVRELANLITTLDRMLKNNMDKTLAEYEFDLLLRKED